VNTGKLSGSSKVRQRNKNVSVVHPTLAGGQQNIRLFAAISATLSQKNRYRGTLHGREGVA